MAESLEDVLSKLKAGKPFFSSHKTLQQQRLKAKTLCFEYNQIPPGNYKRARKVLQSLFGQSPNPWIEAPFQCDYGFNIHTGKNFYANHGVIILDAASVIIGDDVLLGPNVVISTSSHPIDPVARAKGLQIALPVTLGNNVWVGMGAQILAGVTIGNNAIIAAGAVVNSDVPDNTMVAGIPAVPKKVIQPD